jgi:hypothetical protein
MGDTPAGFFGSRSWRVCYRNDGFILAMSFHVVPMCIWRFVCAFELTGLLLLQDSGHVCEDLYDIVLLFIFTQD